MKIELDLDRPIVWQSVLGIVLIALSALVYCIHFLIFRDMHHIMLYLVGDIAFVFVEVLLVTIVIHNLLAIREKKALLNKLNMVIGAFYSEVGMKLIRFFIEFDCKHKDLAKELAVKKEWADKHFDELHAKMAKYVCSIDCGTGHLDKVKELLVAKRDFMLRLLENPNLLEHEEFTDLLWAVFHLTEELENRDDLRALPKADLEHIAGDIKRSYTLLVAEWLAYMKHLRTNYPYLFSLAMRTNPFDPSASVTVKS